MNDTRSWNYEEDTEDEDEDEDKIVAKKPTKPKAEEVKCTLSSFQ
jgi:poly [ADP-ribose] polymerase